MYIFIGALMLHLSAIKNRGTLYLVVRRTLVFPTGVFYCLSKYTIAHYSNDQRTRSIIMAYFLLLFMHLQRVLVFTNAQAYNFFDKKYIIDFRPIIILNNFHIKDIMYFASQIVIFATSNISRMIRKYDIKANSNYEFLHYLFSRRNLLKQNFSVNILLSKLYLS